jgi:hypothetical protein
VASSDAGGASAAAAPAGQLIGENGAFDGDAHRPGDNLERIRYRRSWLCSHLARSRLPDRYEADLPTRRSRDLQQTLITAGRSEVTALGDEVNEAARIEACATGGRALAAKSLIERLETDHWRHWGSTPTTSRTPRSPTSVRPPRRLAATHPRSPVCDITDRAI